MGLTFLLQRVDLRRRDLGGPDGCVRGITVPVAHLVVREPGHPHRGTEFRLTRCSASTPGGSRRRPHQAAVRPQRRRAHRLRGLRTVRHRDWRDSASIPGPPAPSYGLAEATCAVASPPPAADCTSTRSSTRQPIRYADTQRWARPIPGMELRIAPTERSAAGDREIGEIEIRGTSMMSGYLGQESLDADAGSAPGISDICPTPDWWCAGATRNSSPWRVATVFPTEIERVAAQVRGVRDGAVVAVGTDDDAVAARSGDRRGVQADDESDARSRAGAAGGVRMRRRASRCGVHGARVRYREPRRESCAGWRSSATWRR